MTRPPFRAQLLQDMQSTFTFRRQQRINPVEGGKVRGIIVTACSTRQSVSLPSGPQPELSLSSACASARGLPS